MMDTRDRFEPGDLLTFIELRSFTSQCEKMGFDTDDLLALQMAIMENPSRAPVIPGTGGLRKLRFSQPGSNAGRRGGLRVCFVFFEEYKVVLLSMIYSKSRQDDLSAAEKARIKSAIDRI